MHATYFISEIVRNHFWFNIWILSNFYSILAQGRKRIEDIYVHNLLNIYVFSCRSTVNNKPSKSIGKNLLRLSVNAYWKKLRSIFIRKLFLWYPWALGLVRSRTFLTCFAILYNTHARIFLRKESAHRESLYHTLVIEVTNISLKIKISSGVWSCCLWNFIRT